MSEPTGAKRVDESWKEQAEREKRVPSAKTPLSQPPQPSAETSPAAASSEEPLQARFDLFISGLAMEALIALGDMPHPSTRKQAANLPQARYLVDLLGVISEKTKGNLTVDEDRLLNDTLYQLRMRYLNKAGAS